MKTVLLILISISTLLVISSCEKEESVPEFEDIPVIEAYLHVGQNFELKVSRQIPFSGEAVFSEDDISQLEIIVNTQDQNYPLLSVGNGIYSNESLFIGSQMEYKISFSYNNKNVEANTNIPSKPSGFNISTNEITIDTETFPPVMPDPIEVGWQNDENTYFLIVVENIETDPEPINESGVGGRTFRNEPTQNNNYQINSRSFSYVGTHRIIIFHLNPDYAKLYDDSGNTSQNLTTPNSSIQNGFGIFTGINSDTLYFEVKKN